MFAVIIVAAGSSRRMGFDKLMAPLNGKPVLHHTVQAFLNAENVSQVVLVTPQERLDTLAISDDRLVRVDGGKDRHDSVSNGLAAIDENTEYIAVHDGARPLITSAQISRVLEQAKIHRAATSARKVTETVKRSNNENFASESVSRENLWLMETPQIFDAKLLREAYAHITETGALVTDEVSALELIGVPTYLVENPDPNLKITFQQDLDLAEILQR